jgi:hypothetical protein
MLRPIPVIPLEKPATHENGGAMAFSTAARNDPCFAHIAPRDPSVPSARLGWLKLARKLAENHD